MRENQEPVKIKIKLWKTFLSYKKQTALQVGMKFKSVLTTYPNEPIQCGVTLHFWISSRTSTLNKAPASVDFATSPRSVWAHLRASFARSGIKFEFKLDAYERKEASVLVESSPGSISGVQNLSLNSSLLSLLSGGSEAEERISKSARELKHLAKVFKQATQLRLCSAESVGFNSLRSAFVLAEGGGGGRLLSSLSPSSMSHVYFNQRLASFKSGSSFFRGYLNARFLCVLTNGNKETMLGDSKPQWKSSSNSG